MAADDCDDDDANLLEIAFDADCDGVQVTADCDDNDSTDAALSGDCDQDGVASQLDCVTMMST